MDFSHSRTRVQKIFVFINEQRISHKYSILGPILYFRADRKS